MVNWLNGIVAFSITPITLEVQWKDWELWLFHLEVLGFKWGINNTPHNVLTISYCKDATFFGNFLALWWRYPVGLYKEHIKEHGEI